MLKKFDQSNYQLAMAMAVSRFEHMQEEYTNMHASYNEPSQFTSGYEKAIAHIEMSNYNNHGIFQGYKYAHAVIDEEIVRGMEYHD